MGEVHCVVDCIRVAEGHPHELTLLLRQKGQNTYLPIWISQHQGKILANELNGIADLTSEIDAFLDEKGAAHSDIKAAIVCLDGDTFLAKLLLSGHPSPYEVRSPIGLALAIAVRTGAPILADESLFDRAGVGLSF